MTAVQMVSGAVRDVVRTGVLAGLRARGDVTGRLLDPTMYADPYPTYDWLREQPLVESNLGPCTTRYGICSAALRHPQMLSAMPQREQMMSDSPPFLRWLFSTPDRTGLIDPIGVESMLGMDGAGHARLRKLVSSVFTPAAVERLRPRLTEVAYELVAAADAAPTFDLMTGLAGPLPVRAICEVLGVPAADAPTFRRWGAAMASDLDSLSPAHRQRAATRSLREAQTYFEQLIAARRRTGGGDDILSRLVEAEGEGGRLSERELVTMAVLLLLAGFETTVNLIGNGTAALLQHPEQVVLLRAQPELIPAAVEEMLRYDAPVQIVARVPATDLQIEGVHLQAGRLVSLMLAGANRDPEVFADPSRFDVRRPNARKHLSFAAGPHHCLGASLARLEAEVAFTALLGRFERLTLAGRPRRRRTFLLRGFASIPLATR